MAEASSGDPAYGPNLRVVEGPNEGLVVPLSGELILGRADSADRAFEDTEISRHHLRVAVEDGEAVAEDLGSTNGTFVNGERLTGRRTLQAGDRIKLGKTVLEYVAPPRLAATEVRQVLTPEAGRIRSPELRVVEGPETGRAVPLTDSVVIGRGAESDLQLSDTEVSRRHVSVGRQNGGAVVEDLGSTNGTYVNGERIVGSRPLRAGDRLEVGNATLELGTPGLSVTRIRQIQPTSVRQVIAQPSILSATTPSSRKWWTLIVVCVGSFMLLLDTTIVAVALPKISTSLNTSFSELQWVVDAYSLTLAAGLLTAGSLSDILGRRIIFVIGVVIFTASSAACGLAPTAVFLDVARGVQGIGGAMMLAPALALLAQEFPPQERGNAFGIWGAVTAVAIATGPIVGGILTDTIGWESVFYVNIPIGIAVLAVTLWKVVNLPGPPTRIDWAGLVVFSAAAFMLIFALIRGNDEGWGSTLIIALIGGSVVLFIVFTLIETVVRAPMLQLSLFRKPTTSGASIVAFAVSASSLALIIYITLWLQSIRHYSPLDAGLRLLPITALGLILKPLAGRATEKAPPGLFLGAGLAFIAGGVAQMSSVGTSSGWTVIFPGLILTGIGLGMVGPTLAAVAVGIVPSRQSGMASGINTTFRQLGLVIGIAGLGAIFQHQVQTHVTKLLKGGPEEFLTGSFSQAVSSGGADTFIKKGPAAAKFDLTHAAAVSFSSGLSEIFIVGAVVALVGAIAGALLVRRKDLVAQGPPPQAAGGPPPQAAGGPPQPAMAGPPPQAAPGR